MEKRTQGIQRQSNTGWVGLKHPMLLEKLTIIVCVSLHCRAGGNAVFI